MTLRDYIQIVLSVAGVAVYFLLIWLIAQCMGFKGRRIMATREGRIKEQVKDLLKAYEAYWHCPVQNGMGAPSLDFVGCSKGRYFTVETKAESKGMTPRQELTATAIKKAGGKVFLINETSGMDELKEWITDETE